MAVLMLAGVGIDRAISWRLFADPSTYVPAYRSFQDYDIGVKLGQFRAVENQHFGGFFVGNSRTLFGVNPAVFDATLARAGVRFHSYNLAQESVDVRLWQPFFRRFYSRPPPRYVFLGVQPRDLDAGYTAQGSQYLNAFFSTAGFKNRNMSGLNRWGEEALSRLFILHGRISDTRLVSLSDILHGRKLNLDVARLANAQGWMQLPASALNRSKSFLRAQARALAHRHGKLPFELGAAQRNSLLALNDWVRGGGGCLILFTTPLLYDGDQWGTIEMRHGFTRAVQQIAREVPTIQFVDLGGRVQSRFGPADFGDGEHLNGRGASRFSSALAGALAPEMRAPACGGSSS